VFKPNEEKKCKKPKYKNERRKESRGKRVLLDNNGIRSIRGRRGAIVFKPDEENKCKKPKYKNEKRKEELGKRVLLDNNGIRSKRSGREGYSVQTRRRE
jgi:hypothetical protein